MHASSQRTRYLCDDAAAVQQDQGCDSAHGRQRRRQHVRVKVAPIVGGKTRRQLLGNPNNNR